MDLRTMTPLPAPRPTQDAVDEDLRMSAAINEYDKISALCGEDLKAHAFYVCTQMEDEGISTDPSNFWSGHRLIIQLERLAIRGRAIIILYENVCGENAARMAGLLCAVHYKVCGIRPVDIHRAIKAKKSEGIDFRSLMLGVKETLPAFNVEAALEGLEEAVTAAPPESN